MSDEKSTRTCPYWNVPRPLGNKPSLPWVWLYTLFPFDVTVETNNLTLGSDATTVRVSSPPGSDYCSGHTGETRNHAMALALSCAFMNSGAMVSPHTTVKDFSWESCCQPDVEVNAWAVASCHCRNLQFNFTPEPRIPTGPILTYEEFSMQESVDGYDDYYTYVAARFYSAVYYAVGAQLEISYVLQMVQDSHTAHRNYSEACKEAMKNGVEEAKPVEKRERPEVVEEDDVSTEEGEVIPETPEAVQPKRPRTE
jgi:hypothetical protein